MNDPEGDAQELESRPDLFVPDRPVFVGSVLHVRDFNMMECHAAIVTRIWHDPRPQSDMLHVSEIMPLNAYRAYSEEEPQSVRPLAIPFTSRGKGSMQWHWPEDDLP